LKRNSLVFREIKLIDEYVMRICTMDYRFPHCIIFSDNWIRENTAGTMAQAHIHYRTVSGPWL